MNDKEINQYSFFISFTSDDIESKRKKVFELIKEDIFEYKDLFNTRNSFFIATNATVDILFRKLEPIFNDEENKILIVPTHQPVRTNLSRKDNIWFNSYIAGLY